MASPRQVAANRENSKKSTGPKTAEGKNASRRNALTHGLAAEVLTTDEIRDDVAERMVEWRPYYDLPRPDQELIYAQMVLASVRLDRCQAEEEALRRCEIERARTRWDDDRRAQAQTLGQGLARRPALVAARLEQTRQGAEWLVGRWRALGEILNRQGLWNDAQVSLALDLTGTPPELRDEEPTIDDPEGLVAREIDRLEALRARSLDPLDAMERAAACAGTPVEPSPAMRRLRRYEATCRRDYENAAKQLHDFRTWPADASRNRDQSQESTPEFAPVPMPERSRWDDGQAVTDMNIPAPPQSFAASASTVDPGANSSRRSRAS